jgi:transcription initiation factor TFIIIB Brf1 subunit/transcription initiation factor TFIIB
MFKLNISHMTKGCKKFDEIIHMNVCNNSNMTNNITKSSDFVQRFCSKLNIGNNICQICSYVCEKAEEYNLVSKCIPPSIAAGSIFLVCSLLKINITKKEISQTCQISEVTISKCYKNLHLYQEHILPKEILLKLYPE